MLTSVKQLYGTRLGASDDEFGKVKDVYFDDQYWAVRYLVADTGTWLPGRKVLLSPHSLSLTEKGGKLLTVKLTRKLIEASPSIDLHKPVSRQFEEEYFRYYGWPAYWQAENSFGPGALPMPESTPEALASGAKPAAGSDPSNPDTHLRSTLAVDGYNIRALDDTAGHVCDFIIDAATWMITHLVVKTGHRFTGKEVLVPVSKVDRISYEASTIFVKLTGEAVHDSPQPASLEIAA